MEIVSYAMGEGAGYDEGYKAGEESTDAYQEGYSAGETAGYNSGYSAGYTDGAASITPSAKKLLAARNGDSLFATKIYSGSGLSINTGVKVLADGVIKAAINYDDFEDCTSLNYLFRGQCLTTEFPTFNTSNVTSAAYAFADCFEEEHGGEGCTAPYLDLYKVTNVIGMFAYEHPSGSNRYSHLKAIPLYDVTSVTKLTNLFKGCSSLVSIPALNFSSIPEDSTAFVYSGSLNGWTIGCYALREIHIVDIHYSINITASTAFTREALIEIIGNLRDMTGSTARTLTMGSTNMEKLTTDDIAVATAKNWTIA